MRIKNKKSPKKLIIITSVVVVLLAAGGVYAFRQQLGLTPPGDTSFTAPTDQERLGQDTAEQNETNPDWGTKNDGNDTNTTNDSSQSSSDAKNAANEVIISSINQDGTTLAIRTIIQPLVSGGQCTLAMSKVGQSPVRQTAGVQNMPSYSTCQGFNVDVSNMAKGSWNVEITYTKNGASKVGRGTAVVR